MIESDHAAAVGEAGPRPVAADWPPPQPRGRVLTIRRRVIGAMARAAAEEQSGVARVGRGGPGFWAWLAGPPVTARLRDGRVHVRMFIVARSGEPLGALVARVRRSVAQTMERQLGLELGEVTVLVDGVSG